MYYFPELYGINKKTMCLNNFTTRGLITILKEVRIHHSAVIAQITVTSQSCLLTQGNHDLTRLTH